MFKHLLSFALGCLLVAASVAAPWEGLAAMDNVHFLLWTKSNRGDNDQYELLINDPVSLEGSPLNPQDPTVLIIHGWNSRGYSGWPVDAKTELLNHGSYNVISVDWELLADSVWYPDSVDYVPQVGAHTAQFLEWLQIAAGLDVTQVQVTGHSLGAHVAGFIGKNLVQFRLPFITGLDPAGPDYNIEGSDGRLDPSDADFVQVIHTDACALVSIQTCVGLRDEVGDVDFFPNGGEDQPGCIGQGKGDSEDPSTRGCNHSRAHDFWIESISGRDPVFKSYPCQDWETFDAGDCNNCGQGCLNMGFHVDHSLKGNYYLRTNRNSPFAQG